MKNIIYLSAVCLLVSSIASADELIIHLKAKSSTFSPAKGMTPVVSHHFYATKTDGQRFAAHCGNNVMPNSFELTQFGQQVTFNMSQASCTKAFSDAHANLKEGKAVKIVIHGDKNGVTSIETLPDDSQSSSVKASGPGTA